MPSYSSIFTSAGVAKLSAAIAAGSAVNLTHMAVGDGNGTEVNPQASQTALVREVWRGAVNSVTQDPAAPQKFLVELVVPAGVGGWTIREVGIFDADGVMIAVGNFPATYKAVVTDGVTTDLIIRVEVIVYNGSIITLALDPNVAVASRSWVTNYAVPANILPGGTTGQVLTKTSNASGAVAWQNPATTVSVVISTNDEAVTLAGGQQTVNLTTTTTTGLAVYVNGIRIPRIAGASGWQQGANNTQVVLGQAYAAGSIAFFTQYDPGGSIPDPLTASQNLADVPDKAAGRANLGVPSLADLTAAAPPGHVAYSARATAPTGWLVANGALVSRTTYAGLFAAIGTTYGAGDGSTTFALPDLRGEFIRALDLGRGVDVGRTLGSAQGAFMPAIPRDGWGTGGPLAQGRLLVSSGQNEIGETLESISRASADRTIATGDLRPRNVALLPLIKF